MNRPDYTRLKEISDRQAREKPYSHAQSLALAEALVREARALGVWPPSDRLAGIEEDIRRARVLNALEDVRDATG